MVTNFENAVILQPNYDTQMCSFMEYCIMMNKSVTRVNVKIMIHMITFYLFFKICDNQISIKIIIHYKSYQKSTKTWQSVYLYYHLYSKNTHSTQNVLVVKYSIYFQSVFTIENSFSLYFNFSYVIRVNEVHSNPDKQTIWKHNLLCMRCNIAWQFFQCQRQDEAMSTIIWFNISNGDH